MGKKLKPAQKSGKFTIKILFAKFGNHDQHDVCTTFIMMSETSCAMMFEHHSTYIKHDV